jgi:hypothetical protein
MRVSGASLPLIILLLQTRLVGAALPGVAVVGGAVTTVAAAHGSIYAGAGARLLVFTPDAAADSGYGRSGASIPLADLVRGVAVANGLAFVAAGSAGLCVYDISRGGDPTAMGSLATPGYAEGVAATGTLALLADGPLGLRVVDVSNPARPSEIGWAFDGRQAMAVVARDHYALVAAGGAGLLVADIAIPSQPVEVASVALTGYAVGVVLSGNFAFVMDSWGGIAVVNVTNPAKPVPAATYATPGWALKGAVAGTTMAVADAYRGVRVLDISDPLHPAETASSEPYLGDAADLAIEGGRIWVADRHDGLRTVPVGSSAGSSTVYDTFGGAWTVAISGNYAYVAALGRGLRIIDITDSAHLVEVGSYPAGNAVGVTVNGGYVYLSVNAGDEQTSGFHVVDARDPRHPKRAGFLPNTALPFGIPRDHTSVGAVSYVTNETGVIIIDAHDPANPVVAGFFSAGANPTLGITVRDNLAYVALESSGLLIVDVSNPGAPKLLASDPLSNAPQDVALSGHYAVVPGRFGSLFVVDVSDPAHPHNIATQLSSGRGITVSGSQAYLGTSGAGIQSLDISVPGSPVLTGAYRTPGYARKGVVQGDRLWIADAENGLWSVPLGSFSKAQTIQAGIGDGARPFAVMTPARVGSMRPGASLHVAAAARLGIGKIRSPWLPRPRRWVVGSTADSGSGSLRDRLAEAGNGDTIAFDTAVFPPDRPQAIRLGSPLPAITQGKLTIDASSAGVTLDGSGLGGNADANGLVVMSDGNVVRGLDMTNFPGAAILVTGGASNNVIGGDRTLGTGPNGRGNTIRNCTQGIAISGSGTSGNIALGNYLGASADGVRMEGWNYVGGESLYNPCMAISGGAKANQVGGTAPGERNLLGNCGGEGLLIAGAETTDNVAIGNYFGINAAGDNFLLCHDTPCQGGGQIGISDRASRNRIGGTGPGERNVISGAPNAGILVNDFGSVDNVISGNYIGTDATGTRLLSNGNFAVWLDGTSSRTRIEHNVIAQSIAAWGDYNVVTGNLMGIDASGKRMVGGGGGVYFMSVNTTRGNRIGGAAPGEGNVIASSSNAVWIEGFGTESNYVTGNLIGTDASGAALPLGTGTASAGQAMVSIHDGSKRNVVGGSSDSDGNLIAGSHEDGVSVGEAGVSFNFIGWNWIGANRDGVTAIGNRGNGLSVDGADHSFVMGNRISANSNAGVFNRAGAATTVRGNAIHGNGVGISVGMSQATAAPVIAQSGTTSVSGTACAGCVVEIFSDSGNQGGYFEGSVRTTASGGFTLTKPGGFRGPNLTATATNADGLTSEFSAAVPAR